MPISYDEYRKKYKDELEKRRERERQARMVNVSTEKAPVKKTTEKKEDKKWYQEFFKGSEAFDDGYDVGDITKTILGTASDLGNSMAKGVSSIVETPIDIVSYATYAGLDLAGAKNAAKNVKKFADRNLSQEVADKYTKDVSISAKGYNMISNVQDGYIEARKKLEAGDTEGAKDSINSMLKSGGKGLVDMIVSPQITEALGFNEKDKKKLVEEIRNNSVSGDTTDKAAELIAYSLSLAGATNLLTKTGTKTLGSVTTNAAGTTIGSGVTANAGNIGLTVSGKTLNLPTLAIAGGMSSGLNEAYQKEGVTHTQAWTKGLTSGVIEGVTEGMFGLMGVGGNELTDQMASKLASQFSSSFGKQAANIVAKGGGESFEELASYTLNWLTDNNVIDKMKGADFKSEWDWHDVSEQMALAFISAGVTQGSSTALQVNNRVNEIINEKEQELGRNLTNIEKKAIRSEAAQKIIDAENGQAQEVTPVRQETNILENQIDTNTPNIAPIQENTIEQRLDAEKRINQLEEIKKQATTEQQFNDIQNEINTLSQQVQQENKTNVKEMVTNEDYIPVQKVETNAKQKQLDVINKTNKMTDDYHTGIRSIEDIKSANEVFTKENFEEASNPDFTYNQSQEALKNGKVTVYSSNPIENGSFISTSKMMAQDYAGNSKVYSQEVNLDDVAWIDNLEGQYAKTSINEGQSTISVKEVNDTKNKLEIKNINQDILDDIEEFKLGKNSSLESIKVDRFKEILEATETKIPKAFNNVLEVNLDGGVRVKSGTSRQQLDTIYNTINNFKSKINDTQNQIQNQNVSEETIPVKKTLDNVEAPKEQSLDIAPIKAEISDLTSELKNTIKDTKKELKALTKEINGVKQDVNEVVEDVKTITEDIAPVTTVNRAEFENKVIESNKEIKNELGYLPKDPTRASTYEDNTDTRKLTVNPEMERAFDEMQKSFTNKQEKLSEPKQTKTKSKVAKTFDSFQSHFVNRNRQIDNLAKETGNSEIKFKGDRVNNIGGEIGGDIFTSQTDNYGNAIGESLDKPFAEARELGLDEYLDNYLKNLSNIERHSKGKGSNVSADESRAIIRAYRTKYPELEGLASRVNTYYQNQLNNAVSNGLISEETKGNLYSNYVPFIENVDNDLNYVNMSPDEILTSAPIKRAKGGADQSNMLSVEQAMAKQTYAWKNAIAKNDLYKEIVNTIEDKVNVGADIRTDPTTLSDSLYSDESGHYLTAYVDGQQQTVKIGNELFTELNRDLENQIRTLEDKYSLITKPLQKISQIRGQILTTYNPSFIVSNPMKDVADALLNTKNTSGYVKNLTSTISDSNKAKNINTYAEDFKTITGQDITSVTDPKSLKGIEKKLYKNYQDALMWNRFITSYGTNATTMEYGDNNIDVKAKNKGFLNKIANANDYMEVMFRYPEFKAAMEKGKSFTQALYEAREVTTNFGRGGTISKAINRNGATFYNTSIQGLDKFIRNFSGENGAKGFISSVSKAIMLGIAPSVLNHLLLGGIDGDDDEDYAALPDYTKDNYYLFKKDDGTFIRIPKGRMIAVLGSAARRTLELAQGDENAFEGFLKNADSQVGSTNPLKENIFSPLIQAYGSENGEAWYGGDLVPARLQDLPAEEQYDESTDELSKLIGKIFKISPYKVNYVIDQYSGGFGDIALPMASKEAKEDSEGLGMLIAPIKDKFVINSTDDNKYVGDLYDKSEELTEKANGSKATDEDKLKSKYLNSVKSEMSQLYKQKREIQNSDLSKTDKYEQVKEIQAEINELSKNAMDQYDKGTYESNYTSIGGKDFYKHKNSDGEDEWTSVKDEEAEDLSSLGLTNKEKNKYFITKYDISDITKSYKDTSDDNASSEKKSNIINSIKNSGLNDNTKSYLYNKYYDSKKMDTLIMAGVPANDYLDFASQTFESDYNSNGKAVTNSKKNKVINYVNSLRLSIPQKAMMIRQEYSSFKAYNNDIVNYVSELNMSYADKISILESLDMTVAENGAVSWK